MQTAVYGKGDVIFREGDNSLDAYRIVRGSVQVTASLEGKKAIVLAVLTVGDVFGEMAMIDESSRSATVTAKEETEVEIMSPEDFNEYFLKDPYQLIPYLSTLIERLRTTNERLRILMRKLQTQEPEAGEKPKVSLTRFSGKAGVAQAGETVKMRITANNAKTEKTCTPWDFVVDRFPYRIGRTSLSDSPDVLQKNDLGLRNVDPLRVGRNHCVIEKEGEEIYVRDRGSRGGCVVNGAHIGENQEDCQAKLKMGENVLVIGGPKSQVQFKLILTRE